MLLSPAPPPPGRSCTVLIASLPAADRLLDLDLLRDSLRGHPPGTALVAIRFDSVGAPLQPVLLESEPAGVDTAEVLRAVKVSLRERNGRGRWRLELRTGPEMSVRVGHSEACAPKLVDHNAVDRLVEEGTPAGLDGRAVIRFRVEVDGTVGETRVARASGQPALDEHARTVVTRLTFLPGLLDGVPAPMWAELPLEFRVVREGQ